MYEIIDPKTLTTDELRTKLEWIAEQVSLCLSLDEAEASIKPVQSIILEAFAPSTPSTHGGNIETSILEQAHKLGKLACSLAKGQRAMA